MTRQVTFAGEEVTGRGATLNPFVSLRGRGDRRSLVAAVGRAGRLEVGSSWDVLDVGRRRSPRWTDLFSGDLGDHSADIVRIDHSGPRVRDPWGNLWLLFPLAPRPDPKPVWEGGSDTVVALLTSA